MSYGGENQIVENRNVSHLRDEKSKLKIVIYRDLKPTPFIVFAALVFIMTTAAEPGQKAIVLQNKQGKHMGFMLTHLIPTTKAGDYRGDCVFMLLPLSSDLIETELGILISEFKVAGEHPCRMSVSTDKTEFVVTLKNLPKLTLLFAANGKGTLSMNEKGVESQIGLVEFAKK